MRKSFVLAAALFLAFCLTLVSCGGAVANESSAPESGSSGESGEEKDAQADAYLDFTQLDDGTYMISVKSGAELPEEFGIPATHEGKTVTKIADRAFYNHAEIKSVTVPEGVVNIGRMAFSGCTSLVNVELPQGLTTIASGAFKKCAFSEFIVPQSVTFIGSAAFGGCDSLQKIELPFIGETPDPSELPYGFIGHIFGTRFGDSEKIYEFIPRSLKEVVVAEGCVRIPYGAFAHCESLERITLPGSLISIGSFAFEGCGGLVEILYGSTADKWQTVQKSASWDRGTDGTYYDLNVVCTNENDPAVFEKNFKYELLEDGTYCVKLDYRYKTPEELVIPSEHEGAAVTAVELSDLRFVTRIVLPQTVTRVISLKDCTSLTDITLPDSVAEIGESAFVGCTKLKSVKIPKNVARIGVSPFAWCPSLETIEVDEGNERYRAVSGCLIDDATGTIIGSAVYCTVPADEKVTRIGPAALAGVRTENVVIPSNITEIGNSAFSESGARTITLSEGVTTLGMDLCEKCFDLKDLYIPVSVQAINENTFSLTIPDEDPELTVYYAGSREEWAAITSEWESWEWSTRRIDSLVVCLGSVAPVFTSAEEGSCFFTCNLFPGKTVIRSLYNGNTYFVVNEVLFEKEYPSGSAIMFKGQRLMVNGKGGLSVDDCYGAYSPSASGAFGCYYKLEQIGGLIVYEDDYDGTFCSGTVFAENMYDFDRYYTGENYMLLWYAGAMSSEPEWKVLTLDGKVCTLPVPDDKRWAVKSIEFDTSSEDPDDVIVYVYEYKEGYAESQPAAYKANLRRDTRVLEGDAVNAYYCEPVYEFEEYEFDTAVKAPVYIAAGVAGYELPAKAAAYGYEQSLYYTNKDAFCAEVKSYIESFLHAMTGDYITVGVTVYEGYPWGNVNHSDCRILSDGNGRLRFDMYENKLQQLESAPNVNNVFDLNIKYLDDLMDFMGFDKTRLKAYAEPGRIVLMEPASDAADYAYKRSFESIALYVDECRVYEIDAVRRQPEKLAEYETVSCAQALEELANGRYVVPYYNTENGESEAPVYVYDCVLEYAADIYGISDYVPFYRFTVELEIDVGDLYAYVPAVKIN